LWGVASQFAAEGVGEEGPEEVLGLPQGLALGGAQAFTLRTMAAKWCCWARQN
jgi:hypothetical protein